MAASLRVFMIATAAQYDKASIAVIVTQRGEWEATVGLLLAGFKVLPDSGDWACGDTRAKFVRVASGERGFGGFTASGFTVVVNALWDTLMIDIGTSADSSKLGHVAEPRRGINHAHITLWLNRLRTRTYVQEYPPTLHQTTGKTIPAVIVDTKLASTTMATRASLARRKFLVEVGVALDDVTLARASGQVAEGELFGARRSILAGDNNVSEEGTDASDSDSIPSLVSVSDSEEDI